MAIVTGGAGAIGRSILQRLNTDGFTTVSWDLIDDVAEAHLALSVDVTDADALAAAVSETEKRLGAIRVLVVNAGILGPVAPVWLVAPAEVRRVLEVNLVSAFMTLGAVVPALLRNDAPSRGRIVVMASVQGKEGTALAGPYAASKAGLIALVKSLGKELAGEGILVNAITPTVVAGPMERSLAPERRADLLGRIPLGRFLEPDEVAATVSWLCGPGCTFSTGAVFDLSGGRSTY
ncbi:SDR family NAD(P)-dependent oxidoreductase [Bosea sp. PAMC 26642]|uniref:SDR family NAD(P)-dependent oxidoreductase n=1 Tax=Bosea sp. (strain PAMC 26642) TaxID=1792307 RepID=UPI001F21B5DD|nr:SDR family NAD(P)-dependent oxidoreductase [Bosea sp. PAMC 26642]